nr:hypothetical protein [Verrucomicrobium spinosum]
MRGGRENSSGSGPDGRTALWLAIVLAVVPATIALCLRQGGDASLVIVSGLILFGVVFALNSAVHSYLILSYADHDKVAMNVGLYYMANAGAVSLARFSRAGSTRSGSARVSAAA